MLSHLKQYITNSFPNIGGSGILLQKIMMSTRDEKLLNYFIDASRQNVWECQQRYFEILYGFFYDFSLSEDVFYYLDDRYKSNVGYGCIGIGLLMLLYCFFDSDDLDFYFLSSGTDMCCEQIKIDSKTDNLFQNIQQKIKEDIYRYFDINDDYSFEEMFDEWGYMSSSTILSIKLLNENKVNEFSKIMENLGFVKFDNHTWYVFDVDNTEDLPSFDLSEFNFTDIVKSATSRRELDHCVDVLEIYSGESNVSSPIDDLIEDIMLIHQTKEEVLL